jgi:tetratricopeptide (TPR) repeat protein
LRDVALRATPASGRAPLHRRIAIVLDRTRALDQHSAAVIARHYELGGIEQRAYQLYLARTESAINIYAFRSAVELARDAVRTAENDEQRFNALRHAMTGHFAIASITKQYADDVAAFEKAAASLDDGHRFEALQAKANYYQRLSDSASLNATVDELVEMARRSGRRLWIGSAYQQQAMSLDYQGEVRGAIEAARQALQYMPPGSKESLHVRAHRIGMYLRGGEVDKGLAEFETIDKIASETDDALLEARLCIAYQTIAIIREEPHLMLAAGERLIRYSDRTGALGARAVGMSMIQHEKFLKGDIISGRKAASELFEFMEFHAMRFNRLAMKVNVGFCERQCGNLQEAIAIWSETLAEGESEHRGSSIAISLNGLGEAHLMLGDMEKAREFAERGWAVAGETGEERLRLEVGILLSAVEIRAGEFDKAWKRVLPLFEKRKATTSPSVLADDISLIIEAALAADRVNDVQDLAYELEDLYKRSRDTVRTPARACAALAIASEARGEVAAAKRYIFEGVNQLAAHLEVIPDPQTRANYASLPFSRYLTERDPGAKR